MIRGGLFTRFYLEDGIRDTDAYRALTPADMRLFADAVRGLWQRLAAMPHASETDTATEFIFPVLDRLGWHHLQQQTASKGRQDVADALLFLSAEDKAAASRLRGEARFRHGVVVVETEARATRLDRAGSAGETPSSQILRYLREAETSSAGAVRWGLLTNGQFWRLYARNRADGFLEIELFGVLDTPPPVPAGAPEDHWLRVFLLLFRRDAFVPHGPAARMFLDDAIERGRTYQERVTGELSKAVFDTVFPELVAAIARHDPQARIDDAGWRAEAREGALRLLFRLLFVLYAEDRALLPVGLPGYRHYSLSDLRDEAAKAADGGRTLPRVATWWPRLRELFNAISTGDPAMNLPPYNGSLFRDEADNLLRRLILSDAVLAPLIEAVSREGPPLARRWINYRDLSVQQLGAIYERLLERDVVPDGTGSVELRPNAFARKTSGSYYTPDELVQLIIRRAVGPLLAERRDAFAAKTAALQSNTSGKRERLAALLPLDPAERFLDLRICDPAMGSGHFLVALVDYLTHETLIAIAEAPKLVDWTTYRSPLLARVENIRAHIRAQATQHGWTVRDEHLDDPHIVRRIILKRCVYGVDLNPMAVELAKLALWLHSFTVGAPLSFLNHHLRCGDSLFGEFVGPVLRDLHARHGFLMSQAVVKARNAAKGMAQVEERTDADIAEVQASAATFAGVERDTAPLRGFLDIYHAARWLPAATAVAEAARKTLFEEGYGDPVAIAGGAALRRPPKDAADIKRNGKNTPPIKAAAAYEAARDFIAAARAHAAERRFLHWEVAFPGVWEAWESLAPTGGFHAVIGNPPWERMKMQVVEWFAARIRDIAAQPKAADRKRAIATLRARGDAIVVEYDRAAATAETATRVARELGARSPLPDPKDAHARAQLAANFVAAPAYPLLSGGDVNFYSLMVERAARLVRADGIVGVLVPSGIAADLGAAPFFRQISTGGRLAALLDFENRRNSLGLDPFFPDVDSRFKFSVLVFGGHNREFAAAACAFFKQSATAAEAEAFTLAPADFAAVNPNTGTAPVFRTPRDADITRGIYARLPVLVDRRHDPPRCVWPVRYLRMFDMTNDSAKFRTEAELRALGAYEVQGQRWEKGTARWLPLTVGRSVNIFDHRAASVVEDGENLHNPFNSKLTTEAEHADPRFTPRPQFWIADTELLDWPTCTEWTIAFRDIARPTDVRTVIATAAPKVGFGNTAPLLLPDCWAVGKNLPQKSEAAWAIPSYRRFAPLLLGNLNSLILDYAGRQKVQSTHVNLYIIEQLPMIPLAAFARRFGPKSAEDIVREDVLALTYTAHDLAAFAADMGHTGPPLPWNPEDRLRRRARLDALFFHLYGLDRDDAAYVMDTFPIVREQEVSAYGHFRTRALVLSYMAALAAGNPDAPVAG